MSKNFIILMTFVLLAFGSLFYVLSLYSGEDLTGMLSAISGDYKRAKTTFLTNADAGSKLAPPTRSGNCPMSTREGRLIVNAPSDATVRILYAETGAELECRTGGFTKNICRSQFKIRAYKPDSKVFEKTVFLGAGQIATVDVELKPGVSNELPCEGAVSETIPEVPQTLATETAVQETPSEISSTTEQTAETPSAVVETPSQPQETPAQEPTLVEEQTQTTPTETPTEAQPTITETPLPTQEENTPVQETSAEESLA